MLTYLPQLIGGLIPFVLGLTLCKLVTVVWRWFGLNFFFKPPIEATNIPAAIWMKTVPLLVYCGVTPIALITAFAIWDIDRISMPLSHYLNRLIGSPLLFIGALTTVAVIHVILMKSANKDLSN